MAVSKSGHEVYKKILEYGNECFTCGITFPDLKQRLIQVEYFDKDESDDTLIDLFLFSFIEKLDTCKSPNKDKENCNCDDDDFDHLNNCLHRLSKQGCMDLVSLIQSENNEKAAADNLKAAIENLKAAQDGVEISKTSRNIAWVALGISIISLLPSIKDSIFGTSADKQLQQILYKEDSLYKAVFSGLSRFSDTLYIIQNYDSTYNHDSKLQNNKAVFR